MWLGWKRPTFLNACLCASRTGINSQKRRWNDDIVGDLMKCEMYPNWREQVQDHSIWRDWIKAVAEDVNEEMEIEEQSKKDELKQRRAAVNQEQTLSHWRCSEQGCHCAGKKTMQACGTTSDRHTEKPHSASMDVLTAGSCI